MLNTLRLLIPPPPWRPLLLFTAVVLLPGVLDQLRSHGHPLLVFVCCGLGLLPLAVTLSDLVERLIEHLGPRIGGIASVLLGNLVELLVAFNALSGGLYPLVVTSIAGSVLINCLPVLGLGIVIAARGRPSIAIGDQSSDLQNLQLLMSALLLALPSIFYGKAMSIELQGNSSPDGFSLYSATVAVLALGYYLLGFRLHPHAAEPDKHDAIGTASTTTPLAAVVPALGLVTVVVALISERLVDALELLVSGAHLSELFVGLFLLPLFGCLPEMLITMRAATNRNMTLVMSNTVDSSLQLLLFVLPLLVLAGLPLGRHLHLALPPVALAALGIAVLTIDRVTDNREVNAYEGLQLMVLFAAMALGALLLISP